MWAGLQRERVYRRQAGSVFEVWVAFTKLGLRSFGGPVAHLGYFRDEFVTRRRWVDERTYADLVALCQFLPGPASSQTGYALGLIRGGYFGGVAAWAGFTLPSALVLIVFGLSANALSRWTTGAGALRGLQLVAVAIVAQAVWGMARTLCPDRERATIATLAALISLLAPNSTGQIAAILLAGGAGMLLCRVPPSGAPDLVAVDFGLPIGRLAAVRMGRRGRRGFGVGRDFSAGHFGSNGGLAVLEPVAQAGLGTSAHSGGECGGGRFAWRRAL